jgi:hypothetical protein
LPWCRPAEADAESGRSSVGHTGMQLSGRHRIYWNRTRGLTIALLLILLYAKRLRCLDIEYGVEEAEDE